MHYAFLKQPGNSLNRSIMNRRVDFASVYHKAFTYKSEPLHWPPQDCS